MPNAVVVFALPPFCPTTARIFMQDDPYRLISLYSYRALTVNPGPRQAAPTRGRKTTKPPKTENPEK
jgi:hypothetical protein